MEFILALTVAVVTAAVFLIGNSFLAGRKYAEMATKSDLSLENLKPIIREVFSDIIKDSLELEAKCVTIEQCSALRKELQGKMAEGNERMLEKVGGQISQTMAVSRQLKDEMAGILEALNKIQEGMIRREEAELRDQEHKIEMEKLREEYSIERRNQDKEAWGQVLSALKAINSGMDELKKTTADHEGYIRAKKGE